MGRSTLMLTSILALSIATVLMSLLGANWQLPTLIGAIFVAYLWPIALYVRWHDRRKRDADSRSTAFVAKRSTPTPKCADEKYQPDDRDRESAKSDEERGAPVDEESNDHLS